MTIWNRRLLTRHYLIISIRLSTYVYRINNSQPERIPFYFPKSVSRICFGICVCVCRLNKILITQHQHKQTITIYGSSRSLISPLNRSSMFIEFVNSIILHNIFNQLIIPKPYLVLNHITRNVLHGKFKSLISFINRLPILIGFANSINFTKYLITYYFPNSYHDLRRRRIYYPIMIPLI